MALQKHVHEFPRDIEDNRHTVVDSLLGKRFLKRQQIHGTAVSDFHPLLRRGWRPEAAARSQLQLLHLEARPRVAMVARAVEVFRRVGARALGCTPFST